ncbi:glycosyltransferase family protein [Spelaeicoccus albus]|uniref:Spore maturation protein CgeB n=1 Tax=Spelaeicoccus albus TaxID=1280376 RepID=A0A7Z0A8R2_9MICO|nr:glycosyltransferase [Spelaeicoccus albus]NYI66469.1 spore maturation protein CgeB [Spelaeicoccus albus]
MGKGVASAILGDPRKAFWHFRRGGVAGLKKYARRTRIAAAGPRGVAAAMTPNSPAVVTDIPEWPLPDPAPDDGAPTVAVILDDFSLLAFRYEWNTVELLPDAWREQLTATRVDFVFVESAWSGNHGAWKYHLTGASAPRPAVVEMLAWCSDQRIPTVFWNKEDPPHYDDFLDVAKLFDRVFTSDINKLDSYRRDLGHRGVGVLPFAAQPRIHNPVRPRSGFHSRGIAFGGMYFAHKYPERRRQLETLLKASIRAHNKDDAGLDIFARELGGDPNYQFPSPYASHIVGTLSYPQMLTAYKTYKTFLNVNSVVDSPSMCARRIFEITACGTPVVTMPTEAIGKFFPHQEIPVANDEDNAYDVIRSLIRSNEHNDRLVHRGQRQIWAQHTYAHRARAVAAAVGLDESVPARSVSALVSTIRPHQIDHVLHTVAAQRGIDVELVLLTHGFEPDAAHLHAKANELGIEKLTLLSAGRDVPLGDCLNRLVKAAGGDLVAKIDDDDLYGPDYLADQANALMYSGADVVGKQAHYMHLADSGATILRFAEREHRMTDFVMGPTLVTAREHALSVPFASQSLGEDSQFLRDTADAGGTIYSSDRFNFVQWRGGSAGDHTWDQTDDKLLATGVVTFYGDPTKHVMV